MSRSRRTGIPVALIVLAWVAALWAVTASDDFAGSGALSASWTNAGPAGSIQRTSGLAEPSVFGGIQLAKYTGVTFSNDQFSEVVIGPGSATGGGYQSYVFVRSSGTGASFNGYGIQYGDSLPTCMCLIRFDNGSVTILQENQTNRTTVDGDTIRMVVNGTTLSMWKNGTQVGTDVTGQTAYTSGAPGLGGAFTGYDMFESWNAGDVGGGGGGGGSSTPSQLLLLGVGEDASWPHD